MAGGPSGVWHRVFLGLIVIFSVIDTVKPSIARFSAVDKKSGLAVGIVMAPDHTDAQGDHLDADAVKDAMYRWAESAAGKAFTAEHDGPKLNGVTAASFGQAGEKGIKLYGDVEIPAGAWHMTVKVDNNTMAKIEEGTFTGFSVEGHALVEDDEVEVSADELANTVIDGVTEATKEPENPDELEVSATELTQTVVDGVASIL